MSCTYTYIYCRLTLYPIMWPRLVFDICLAVAALCWAKQPVHFRLKNTQKGIECRSAQCICRNDHKWANQFFIDSSIGSSRQPNMPGRCLCNLYVSSFDATTFLSNCINTSFFSLALQVDEKMQWGCHNIIIHSN